MNKGFFSGKCSPSNWVCWPPPSTWGTGWRTLWWLSVSCSNQAGGRPCHSHSLCRGCSWGRAGRKHKSGGCWSRGRHWGGERNLTGRAQWRCSRENCSNGKQKFCHVTLDIKIVTSGSPFFFLCKINCFSLTIHRKEIMNKVMPVYLSQMSIHKNPPRAWSWQKSLHLFLSMHSLFLCFSSPISLTYSGTLTWREQD